jgi:hypothetical protein
MPLFRRRRPVETRPAGSRPDAAPPARIADPEPDAPLLDVIRQDFRPHRGPTYDELSAGLTMLLERDPDGTAAAVQIVVDYVDALHQATLAEIAQYNRMRGADLRLDGHDYAAVYRDAKSMLKQAIVGAGWHPRVHLDAALAHLTAHAGELDPAARTTALDHLLQLVALRVARARHSLGGIDTRDVLELRRLLAAVSRVRAAAGDPPLPAYVAGLLEPFPAVEVITPPEWVTDSVRTDGVLIGRSVSAPAGDLDLTALLREHLTEG